jgi:hypothetical protein
VPSFLLELYLPRGGSLEEAVARVRGLTQAAAGAGLSVRYLRSLHLAEEETCFHVLEAPSREALLEAARRCGLADARVIETVEKEGEEA